ncbi:alpha/beta hydrolase [Dyella choica]|uniref:Alpha/beta hydrolase n=1 Tax=Dyella choica TaxID=1927959 RepID=A0A432M7W9_9GAMM|nr:alpha/beta hydrolase [Dyella choica]RUL77623.1 alpha/beta hydrolase [Dyella choica]
MRAVLSLAMSTLITLSGMAASVPVIAASMQPSPATATSDVSFKASDGVVIHGRYYRAASPRALIVLFHQAGSSKDEYKTIAPKLAAAGYSALAIDQRSGGELFGPNQTVQALGHSADYLDAKPDLEAALSFARQQKLPIILWGSSYSASLTVVVASEHVNEVSAIAVFSPGEYFDASPSMIRSAAAKVTVPFYVTSANDAREIAAAKAILAASPSKLKVQYVPTTGGVHGSSTLIASRDPQGAEDNWKAILGFLDRLHL